MASTLHFLVISLCCSFLFLFSESQTDPQSHVPPNTRNKPNLLVLPVQHDASSGLHWANIHKRTPLMQVPVLVDINGKHLWVNCDQHYSSSTYQAPFCHSTQCSRANTHLCHTCVSESRPGCHNNTCGLMSSNPVTEETGIGELAQDVLAIQTTTNTRGYSRLGPMVRVPQFLFSCAPSFLAQKGLPNNVQGVAGLGHAPISLPSQLSSYFGLQRQFTMCLSRNPSSNGAIIFGDAPNNMRYNQYIFHDLAYTPLTISPHLGEYYIQITSIRINQHNVVPFNPTMLSSNPEGVMGGTLITTTSPYTILHESIFETFAKLYANQIPREARVNAVGPFGLCFDSKRIGSAAPYVDLVMDKPNVVWRISGENLLVQARPGVTCLGIVNGGKNARAPIALGARQLEENVVVVDLARSRLGFSTSLQSHGKKCADLFDFNNPA